MLKKLVLIALLTPLNLLPNLSLREKIGQMIVAAVMADPSENPDFVASQKYNLQPEHALQAVRDHKVGGFIFLGPNRLEKMIALRNELQKESSDNLFFFLDSEWGLSMRVPKNEGVITYPRAMTLGALSPENDHLIQECGKEIGRQLKTLGLHSPLAPVCDVNNNPKNPIINTRSFGQDPAKVAKKSTLYMRGIEQAGLIACGKHFPGHGDVDADTHGNKRVTVLHSLDRLNNVELVPFRALIKNRISAIMTAHLDVPAITQEPNLPATFSKKVTNLLRNDMNFKGLIITDGLGMGGAAVYDDKTVAINAVKAGADILLCPVNIQDAIDGIEQAVHNGEIKEQEIDEHITRITAAKKRVCSDQKIMLDMAQLNNPQARKLKQQLYESAITMARNNNHRLPIKKNYPIRLVTIGSTSENHFAQELQKNNLIDQLLLPIQATEQECSELLKELKDTQVLVALHLSSRSGMIEMQKKDNESKKPNYVNFINSLGESAALILFCNPYNLAKLPHSQATIVAYEDEPEAQIAAAHTVLGIHNPTGQLPVSASDSYPAGTSLSFAN